MDTCICIGVSLCCPPEIITTLLISAGQLTALGQQSDSYICARKGGTCNLSPCPLYNRIEGTCYRGKAKCCIR
uniref:Beta-defensin 1 n=1 Tax=Bos indicus x Bos taurus TaxID=30522 RepID=A0A4W2G5D1_BOBOX